MSPVLSMMVSAATGKMYLVNSEAKTYTEFQSNEAFKSKLKAYGIQEYDKYKWTPWKKVSAGKLKNIESTVYRREMIKPPSDKDHHLHRPM